MKSASNVVGVCLGLVFALAAPAVAAEHLEPVPAIAGTPIFLEAEGAASMTPIWNSITLGGIDCVYRAPAADGWFQYEGLSLADGNYETYVSWTRPGSGWLTGEVWAGPDAENLRLVIPYYETVGLSSYVFEWDPIGATNGVADAIPLLATDTVVKIYANSTASELEIDCFMLSLVPEPDAHMPGFYYMGEGWHLEAEDATSMGPVWTDALHNNVECIRRETADEADCWIQWEGIEVPEDGMYDMFLSWARNGAGWITGKVEVGPDAGSLREVVSYYEAVTFDSYQFGWDTVASQVSLNATDRVFRITCGYDAAELYVDDLLLATSTSDIDPGDPCDPLPPPGPEWGRGHDILIRRGMQIEAQVFPGPTDSWDLDLWAQSNFTAACIQHYYDPNIMGPPPGVPWGQYDSTPNAKQMPYVPNLVSLQYSDEQDLNQEINRANAAAYISNWREQFPHVLGYTNQGGNVPTPANMADYLERAEPDLLMQDVYPFFNGPDDLTNFYYRLELYRSYALQGNPDANDTIRSIPHGMYLQTYAEQANGLGTHEPSDSELRLNAFSCWAFGCTFASGYVYQTPYSHLPNHALLFDGVGDSNPTAAFYQMAETNRQSLNLGPALTRLVSTKTFMIANQYSLPSNVPAWSASDPCSDPYITSITATNLNGHNGGNPSDVLVGYFKPLHESFDGPDYSDQDYFMIVNGLCADGALVSETQQRIDIEFDFGTSGISQLQRVSRDTGDVEDVSLISMGGSLYKLEMTLPGGTGDLFKFDTGAAFVNGPFVCGDIGTEYLPADLSGSDGSPDCDVDQHDLVAVADQWLMGMTTAEYTLTPIDRGSTSYLVEDDPKVDTGFDPGAIVGFWTAPVWGTIWEYWEKYEIPEFPAERISGNRGVVANVNLTYSYNGNHTPGIWLYRSAHDSWVTGPPRTISAPWPATESFVTNRLVTSDGSGMGLVESDLSAWFETADHWGPEGEGRTLTIKYVGGGGGARGGYLGTSEDQTAGCTLTITTEPDLGLSRSADISGPAGQADGIVDLFDFAVLMNNWLGSSHPGQ